MVKYIRRYCKIFINEMSEGSYVDMLGYVIITMWNVGSVVGSVFLSRVLKQ